MSNLLTVQVTAEDLAAATERKGFNNEAVTAGEYDMLISATTAPLIKIGKESGNPYLSLVLNHAEKGRGANVFVQFTSHPIGVKQFAQMLLSAGYSMDQVLGASYRTIDGASERAQGGTPAEIVLGDGSIADLAGRPVRVWLKQTKNNKGETKNDVSNFITA